MSDPTLEAISGLRGQVSELRVDLTSRLDSMVTRREHDAEVRRIDTDIANAKDQLLRHESTTTARLSSILDEMATDREAIAEREAERQAQRRADRRWLIGAIFSGTGAAVAVGQLLIRLI